MYMYTDYCTSGVRYLEKLITLRFVKKHVSYTWIISSASMLGGQKRGGGGSSEPPRTPPVYGPV